MSNRIRLTFCLLLINSLSFCFAQDERQPPTLKLHWTDKGVGGWKGAAAKYLTGPIVPGLRMGDDFGRVGGGFISGVPPLGQILIPMPSDPEIPKTAQQWEDLRIRIRDAIANKVSIALKSELSEIEIRQIENITLVEHVRLGCLH